MACKKCGSDWVTQLGDDCVSCPHCCKQQRCRARKEGRWVEPTQQKTCEECGAEFTAVGLHGIAIQVICKSPACKSARHKRKRLESAARRAAGIYTLPREAKPKRHCQFSGCGKELTRRDQNVYCCKPCYFAAIDAGEQQFKGRVRDAWAGLVDWAYEWGARPFGDRPRGHESKLYKPRPPCEVCGKECKHRHGKCCSRDCKKKWRGPRACKCGATVEHAKAFGLVYCAECKRESRRLRRHMYGSHKRRCRTYGGYFNKDVRPTYVFRRDKWVCHLCGLKTHKVFSVDDPLSATVDHYPIPLCDGGDHDWHNVRCACYRCNSLQGSRTGYKLDEVGRVVSAMV